MRGFTNLDKRDDYVSWQDVWAAKSNWRSSFDLRKRADYTGVGWYEPLETDRWSDQQCDQTFSALSRLASQDDSAAIDAVIEAKRIFATGGAPMPEHDRGARMSELMFAAPPAGGPFLLENRIHVLRLAANIHGRGARTANLPSGRAVRIRRSHH
jgi:hypothetical protein